MPPEISGPGAARIELIKRIGAGSFGAVYLAKDNETGKEVAAKFEDLKSKHPQLDFEYEVSKKLAGRGANPQGFALPCLYFANTGKHRMLVMPMLGYCIEDVMQKMGGKLGVKSCLMIVEQIIRRLEYIHSLGMMHRDIKPENFMFGPRNGPQQHIVYLIDFGLSRAYWDKGQHRPMRTGLSLTGTARYASINAHKGFQQSRRDDLEAISYMVMYLLRGAMPWSGLAAKTTEEKYAKIADVKEKSNLDELCAGFPECFKNFIITTRGLDYTQKPDYAAYRAMFQSAFDKNGYELDYQYDWCKSIPSGLDPVDDWKSPRQPDEAADEAPSTNMVVGDACQMTNSRRSKMSAELLKIRQSFESMDVNQDGGIDQAEFKKVLLSIGRETAEIDSMFEMADVNKDGKVVYEEFVNWFQKDIPPEVREELYALHGDGDN